MKAQIVTVVLLAFTAACLAIPRNKREVRPLINLFKVIGLQKLQSFRFLYLCDFTFALE